MVSLVEFFQSLEHPIWSAISIHDFQDQERQRVAFGARERELDRALTRSVDKIQKRRGTFFFLNDDSCRVCGGAGRGAGRVAERGGVSGAAERGAAVQEGGAPRRVRRGRDLRSGDSGGRAATTELLASVLAGL